MEMEIAIEIYDTKDRSCCGYPYRLDCEHCQGTGIPLTDLGKDVLKLMREFRDGVRK